MENESVIAEIKTLIEKLKNHRKNISIKKTYEKKYYTIDLSTINNLNDLLRIIKDLYEWTQTCLYRDNIFIEQAKKFFNGEKAKDFITNSLTLGYNKRKPNDNNKDFYEYETIQNLLQRLNNIQYLDDMYFYKENTYKNIFSDYTFKEPKNLNQFMDELAKAVHYRESCIRQGLINNKLPSINELEEKFIKLLEEYEKTNKQTIQTPIKTPIKTIPQKVAPPIMPKPDGTKKVPPPIMPKPDGTKKDIEIIEPIIEKPTNIISRPDGTKKDREIISGIKELTYFKNILLLEVNEKKCDNNDIMSSNEFIKKITSSLNDTKDYRIILNEK